MRLCRVLASLVTCRSVPCPTCRIIPTLRFFKLWPSRNYSAHMTEFHTGPIPISRRCERFNRLQQLLASSKWASSHGYFALEADTVLANRNARKGRCRYEGPSLELAGQIRPIYIVSSFYVVACKYRDNTVYRYSFQERSWIDRHKRHRDLMRFGRGDKNQTM